MNNLPETIIDRDELMERIDQDWELLTELVEMFADEAEDMLTNIDKAISTADSEGLFRAGHTAKSAVGNFAAKRVQQLALELEMMGRNNQMQEAQPTFEQLKLEMEIAKKALQTLLNEGNQ